MRIILFFLAVFATPAVVMAQVLPLYLARVSGVAANDQLNIRETPDAGAAIIGALPPDSYIDVVSLDVSGKWALVSPEIGFGWVSSRFLTTLPFRDPADDNYPYALPSLLECEGLEPAWSLDISKQSGLTTFETAEGYFSYRADEGAFARDNPVESITSAMGRHLDKFALTSGRFSGVLTRGAFDDGSTDTRYAWSLDLFRQEASGGIRMFSGFCRALQP